MQLQTSVGLDRNETVAAIGTARPGQHDVSVDEVGDIKLDYNNVLMVPGTDTCVASRKDVEMRTCLSFNRGHGIKYTGVPIMAANMDGVGSLAMAKSLMTHGIFTCLAKTHSSDDLLTFFREDPRRKDFCAITVGLRGADRDTFRAVMNAVGDLKYVCLDVANGHTNRFVRFVETFRNEFPDLVIIAGNVVTPEQVLLLVSAGADLVKVGIGSGSVCETRIKTGVGFPQFSAVIECSQAAYSAGARIVADGGCTGPGDVAKALAAGAAFVMLGGMLAGHKEGGGEIITRKFATSELDANGRAVIAEQRYVEFYGMSSQAANEKHFDGLGLWRTSEGREVLLPYRPSLDDTVRDIFGGLRSACTYLGAPDIASLPSCTRFVRCNDTHNRLFEDYPALER
ncbi:MAG: IMP dehydrogenase [Rhodobacteraceae bacterium]|nr:IMP dehydrogenase [Paracoccaceae bacterium]